MRSKVIILFVSILLTIIMIVGCDSSKKSQYKSDETTTINNTETEPQPETEAETECYAVDLVNKPLSEILEMMDNDFGIEYEGDHLIHYTSGGLCIFNDQKIPGFAFFISPEDSYSYDDLAAQDNLIDVKQDVLLGRYKIDFIGVYDHAKYNEKISADMKYLEVSEVIGSYEFLPMVGAAIPRQAIGSNATVYYDAQGEMSEETAKTANPSIKGIAVFPTKEDEQTEVAEKAENEPADEHKSSSLSDYSSYLGSWNFVYDNDGQLDANYAVVTSVTFNRINGTSADITIFKGNISKVCQIDITGEIVDDKIEFSYDKDGWENSGHGTITLNGDSVHLSAKVDSYGPNARMGLESDDDLTR